MGPQKLQVVDHVDFEPIGLPVGSGDRQIGHPHPAADHAYHARIGKDLELDHRGVANGDHGGPLAARNVGFHRQQAALSHDHFKSRIVAPQRIDERRDRGVVARRPAGLPGFASPPALWGARDFFRHNWQPGRQTANRFGSARHPGTGSIANRRGGDLGNCLARNRKSDTACSQKQDGETWQYHGQLPFNSPTDTSRRNFPDVRQGTECARKAPLQFLALQSARPIPHLQLFHTIPTRTGEIPLRTDHNDRHQAKANPFVYP